MGTTLFPWVGKPRLIGVGKPRFPWVGTTVFPTLGIEALPSRYAPRSRPGFRCRLLLPRQLSGVTACNLQNGGACFEIRMYSH